MQLPASILRSCVRVAAEDPTPAEQNLRTIMGEFTLEGVDGFLLGHLQNIYDATGQVPLLDQARDWCIRQELRADGGQATAALDRLEAVPEAEPMEGPAFRYAIDAFRDELLREGVSAALVEAGTVLSTGIQTQVREGKTWTPKTLRGPLAAMEMLSTRMNAITKLVRSGSMEGEMRADVQSFQREMERRASRGLGVLSGIRSIDDVHFGLHPGHLAFVLAFTSHYKSTFCLNWAYRAAVYQQKNVGIVSLEMGGFSLQTVLSLLHCAHPQFDAIKGSAKITVENIRTGQFTPEQRTFFQAVMEDLEQNPTYGRLFFREAQSSMTVTDIQRWSEKIHKDTPLDLLVIDYLGLVDLAADAAGMEQSSYLNRVVRQTKQLAQGFGGGVGIPILSPFQANRDGYKDAIKNNGRYKLTAMSWANEAEKSADFVYSLFLDDALQATNELILGNLKCRDAKVFTELPRVFADPDTRLIADLSAGAGTLGDDMMNL